MDIPLDEVVYFDFITSHPSTGAATDADSTPTFAVYEEATDTDIGVGGNATKRTSLTGNYRLTFTCSAANGFELGKWYSIIASATVNSVAGKCVVKTFRIVAAEVVAGYPVIDAGKWLGGTIPSVNVTGVPLVDAKYLLGTVFSTPTVAGIPNVNCKTWNDLATVALPLVPTTAGRTLDVSAGGEAGVDWANVGTPGSTVNLSATTVNLVNTLTTYTGNTPQTGDSYAIVNSGVHGNAAIKGYVDDIGTAGAGLTAVPWNAAWDAEVQSEVQDAIEANHLDHFIAIADPGGVVANSSFLAKMLSKSATPAFTSYDNTTDSLEALRDNTGAAGAGLTALGDTRLANLDAAVSGRMATYTQPAGFLAATFPTTVASTTNITSASGVTLTSSYDFAKGTVAVTESYNSDGSAPTPVQALMGIMQMLMEMSISGTTMTIRKLDGSTTAFTLTLNSSTTPTSVSRTG